MESHGKGFGVFGKEETAEARRIKKALSRAQKLARDLGVQTTVSSLWPSQRRSASRIRGIPCSFVMTDWSRLASVWRWRGNDIPGTRNRDAVGQLWQAT